MLLQIRDNLRAPARERVQERLLVTRKLEPRNPSHHPRRHRHAERLQAPRELVPVKGPDQLLAAPDLRRLQARPRDPAHLPSARRADRGAHLRLLHRLLPARHPEEPRPAARQRPHPARHPRGVRHHPDGGRPPADHRRPAPRPAAPHPAEQGARATTAPARHDPPATTRAADLRLTAHRPRLRSLPCSADLWGSDRGKSMG